MKEYYFQYNIGKSKYVVCYSDGQKKHKDGSMFFDVAIFKSKTKMDGFVSQLLAAGYTYR